MKTYLWVLTLCLGFGAVSSRHKGVNGGLPCAGCTFAVGIIEQLAQVHNESIASVVDNICNLLPPGGYQMACVDIIDKFGPIVIDLLYQKATPDIVCHSIHFCHVDPGKPVCHLFDLPKKGYKDEMARMKQYMKYHFSTMNHLVTLDLCSIPGIKFICELYERVFSKHIPLVDVDLDGFSTIPTMRGTSWRGKDCAFDDNTKYPGTKPKDKDIEEDTNCNGIYGVNKAGVPYEDLYCKDTMHLGIGLLGDSAGAHFHIPPEWLIAKVLTKDILTHLPFVVENEFDWPHMSAYTGFVNVTWPVVHGPVQSMYTLMKERRNRCIHRDYQNLGVNGANSSDILTYQSMLTRNHTADYPMLLFYALVGNDVCNGYPDTVAHMATPEKMEANALETFTYLDTKLPPGSHVLIVGLADGRVLYNNMYKRFHPIGETNHDITYPMFYDFLQCLEISPCNGWMTTNSTLREVTWERVQQLNAVLKRVAQTSTFKNFDLLYLDCPLMPVLEDYEKKHGKGTAWQLIEPVDGFHPNQYALELSALYTWNFLEETRPSFLGEINPHNADIASEFGDQNGY